MIEASQKKQTPTPQNPPQNSSLCKEQNCEWDIGENTNRSVQMEQVSENVKCGYKFALDKRHLPVMQYSKPTVFALLAVPALACAKYYSDQPVFPMDANTDLYAIEFVNTFVESGNVQRCMRDESFKRRFLKSLGQGKFLYNKWGKSEATRPLTKRERWQEVEFLKLYLHL